ncbi:MAG: diacylglycerol kinase family protein [Bacteroidota bacterium]
MKTWIAFIRSRTKSFGYAFKGIGILFGTQVNARIHALAVVVIVALGVYLGLSMIEWAIIAICMGMVLAAEATNTAIESIVDLVSPDYHKLAGRAKDLAAGAVLLSVIFCGIAWSLIFLPKIWAMIQTSASAAP